MESDALEALGFSGKEPCPLIIGLVLRNEPNYISIKAGGSFYIFNNQDNFSQTCTKHLLVSFLKEVISLV
jgi:hypothetical protein